jgi:hypothetical protein
MMRPLIVIAGLLLVLSGCLTRGFVREDATEQDFYRELQQCSNEAYVPDTSCYGAGCAQWHHQDNKDRKNLCMKARGWRISRDLDAFRD